MRGDYVNLVETTTLLQESLKTVGKIKNAVPKYVLWDNGKAKLKIAEFERYLQTLLKDSDADVENGKIIVKFGDKQEPGFIQDQFEKALSYVISQPITQFLSKNMPENGQEQIEMVVIKAITLAVKYITAKSLGGEDIGLTIITNKLKNFDIYKTPEGEFQFYKKNDKDVLKRERDLKKTDLSDYLNAVKSTKVAS